MERQSMRQKNGGLKSVPTIGDIAREVGVSTTTVNRALRNRGRVSAETKKRILAAVERLGYRPSIVAQSLAKGRSSILGVIVPMIGNTTYSPAVEAVEQLAREYGYSIILCNTDHDRNLERECLKMMYGRRVEGLLVVPASIADIDPSSRHRGYDHLVEFECTGVPVVVMEQRIPDNRLKKVYVDNYGDSRRIVRHLVGLGHKRIGFFHFGMGCVMVDRHRGYRQALEDAGLPCDDSLTERVGEFNSPTQDFMLDKVYAYLARHDRPTAIFAACDMLAIKVMRAIQTVGLRVPEDIAVVGYDDIPMAEYAYPPLTTVQQPATEIARRAGTMLLRRISDPKYVPEDECVSGRLRIRESCGNQLVETANRGGGWLVDSRVT